MQKQETLGAAMLGLTLQRLAAGTMSTRHSLPRFLMLEGLGDEVWPCAAGWPAEAA